MTVEENKEFIRWMGQAWNATAGDVNKVNAYYEKYLGPGYVHHSLARGDMSGEQRTQYVLAALPAIPDLNYTLEDMVAEGDKVVARYTARFTHKGTYMGIPATGKQVAAKGVEIYRLAGGKIVESWDFPDTLGMMTQLGAIPGRAPQK